MSFRVLLGEAERLLQAVGIEEPELEIPKDLRFGEVSCTSAFTLAKKLGASPLEIAKRLVSDIELDSEGLLVKVEARPPGYINFKVNWLRYSPLVVEAVLEQREYYGRTHTGEGQNIFLEYTSVNPNKALHIGHARNVCIGDTLARLLKFAGYRVVTADYVDDSGNQMADLLLGFLHMGYPQDPPNGVKFDAYCGDNVYVEVNKRLASDPELQKKKDEIAKNIEEGSPELSRLNRMIAERVLADQLKTCWRLGASYDMINMETDVFRFELWDKVYGSLLKSGKLYMPKSGEQAGCWLIDLSKHPVLSKEGDEVIMKSDGTTTYVARDIAYAAWKLGFFKVDFKYSDYKQNPDGSALWITDLNGKKSIKLGRVDKTIAVIDVRQRRPQEVVRFSLAALGLDPDRYQHYAYEVVSLSPKDAASLGWEPQQEKFVHMKGREGLYLKADEMLEMLSNKIVSETKQRHPDWPVEKILKNSEKVASAALRYSLIKVDADKTIVFDSDEATRLEGDTAAYLVYSYARACRILEKVPALPQEVAAPVKLSAQEMKLLRQIAMFPLVVEDAAKSLLIKKIAGYAYDLAVVFSDFYENCPVIRADEPETKKFRASLVVAYKQAIANVLGVLGISPVSEM